MRVREICVYGNRINVQFMERIYLRFTFQKRVYLWCALRVRIVVKFEFGFMQFFVGVICSACWEYLNRFNEHYMKRMYLRWHTFQERVSPVQYFLLKCCLWDTQCVLRGRVYLSCNTQEVMYSSFNCGGFHYMCLGSSNFQVLHCSLKFLKPHAWSN